MSRMHGSTPAAPYLETAPAGEDLTLAGLLAFLLRHRRLILSTGLAAFLLVGFVTFLRHRAYTSTARFMPQTSEGTLGQLSGLAATFGVSVPASDPGSSPGFYGELLKSRDVLRRTVETRYAFAVAGDSIRGTLIDLYESKGKTAPARRDAAAKELLDNIDVTVSRETGTIDLEVTSPYAELSQQIGRRMIELVSEFNLTRRQTKAGAERRFVEARVAEAKDTLHAAEARLQAFLQRNRAYQSAPSLLFEHDRLQRDVSMQQQLYTTLSQSFEVARIDEVRNTPVITLMESPDLPAKPDPRLALVKGILAGLLGLALGAFIAAVRQAFAGFRGPGSGVPGTEATSSGPGMAARRPYVGTAAGPDDA
jgi:tyrosine-protein kinase Etk/Wzc